MLADIAERLTQVIEKKRLKAKMVVFIEQDEAEGIEGEEGKGSQRPILPQAA